MRFEIPYWPGKRLYVVVHRVARRNDKRVIMLAPIFRIKDMPGYEDEWFFRNWKFINLPF